MFEFLCTTEIGIIFAKTRQIVHADRRPCLVCDSLPVEYTL